MTEQPPPHRRTPIIAGQQHIAQVLDHTIAVTLRNIPDNGVRHDLTNVRSVAVAMANVQCAPDRWSATGDSILAHLDDPHTGHLVSAMALHMSLYPSNAHGAIGILEHAAAYIQYIAKHLHG